MDTNTLDPHIYGTHIYIYIYAVYNKPTSDLKTYINCKWEDGKYIFYIKGKQKKEKTGIVILRADKTDIKIKTITSDKEGHYIMIKGPIQDEDIAIVNIYAPNIGAPHYIRQTLTNIKGEIDSNIIIVRDFNTPITPIDRSPNEIINKGSKSLKRYIRWDGSHW